MELIIQIEAIFHIVAGVFDFNVPEMEFLIRVTISVRKIVSEEEGTPCITREKEFLISKPLMMTTYKIFSMTRVCGVRGKDGLR